MIGENKVVVGIGGGDRAPARFFLDAYDTQTGKRLWRFYTVPNAGEPGSETWPNAEAMLRSGGATWTTGSYDPELNLVFWGTGNPYGNTIDTRAGDNLYTSSLVAVDADTGKLRWYYQVVPHDLHDYDANVIPVLAEVRIGGQPRKVVLFAPKTGYLYVLDRANGKFLAAHPMVEGAKTWAKEFRPDGRPVLGPDAPTRHATLAQGGCLTSTVVRIIGRLHMTPPRDSSSSPCTKCARFSIRPNRQARWPERRAVGRLAERALPLCGRSILLPVSRSGSTAILRRTSV